MPSPRILLPAALLLASTVGASTPPAPVEELLRKSDQEKVGKLVAEYFEARRENKEVAEALEKLRGQIDKSDKKLGDTAFLAATDDLRKIFYAAEKPSGKGVKGGKIVDLSIESKYYKDEDGKPLKIEYALRAPSGYKASLGPYPLILALPGQENGENEVPRQHLLERWEHPDLLDGAILAACSMPADPKMWAEVGTQDEIGGTGVLLTIFKDVMERVSVDYDRVFLAGRGPGVGAALDIGSLFPDRFAGVIGRAGDTGEVDSQNFRNLPTILTGAGAEGTTFHGQIEEVGYGNCTLSPDGTEADVWAWTQEQVRASNPEHVTLAPRIPFPNKAYWLEVPPGAVEESALVDAIVDRAANSIVVTGRGVPSVTLFFNDAMLDLDQPIKVVCNGVEHEAFVPRRLQEVLELVYKRRCDPGRLYVARMDYDLLGEN